MQLDLEVEVYDRIQELLKSGQFEQAVGVFSGATRMDMEESTAYVTQIAEGMGQAAPAEPTAETPSARPPAPEPSLAPPPPTAAAAPAASVDFLSKTVKEKHVIDKRAPKKTLGDNLWPLRKLMRHVLCFAQVAIMGHFGGLLGYVSGIIGYGLNMKVFIGGFPPIEAFARYLGAIALSIVIFVVAAVGMEVYAPEDVNQKWVKYDVTQHLPMEKIREYLPSAEKIKEVIPGAQSGGGG